MLSLTGLSTAERAFTADNILEDDSARPLGKVSEAELIDLAHNDEFMMRLYRHVQQLQRLRKLAPEWFAFRFPPDFSQQKREGWKIKRAARGALASLSVLGLSADAWPDIIAAAASASRNVLSLEQGVGDVLKFTNKLVDGELWPFLLNNCEHTGEDFDDLEFGMLHEMWRRVNSAVQNNLAAQTKSAVAAVDCYLTDRHGNRISPTNVKRGAKLLLLKRLKGQISGRTLVSLDNGADEGYLQNEYIIFSPWYRNDGTDIKIIPVDNTASVDSIMTGEMFVVTRRTGEQQNWWLLADGRGWIQVDASTNLAGPIDGAREEKLLQPPAPGHEKEQATANAKSLVFGVPFLIGRMTILGGCMLGGFFTGGAGWLLAGAACTASWEVASFSLLIDNHIVLEDKVAYLMAQLYQFENQRLDFDKSANICTPDEACPRNHTCLYNSIWETTTTIKGAGYAFSSRTTRRTHDLMHEVGVCFPFSGAKDDGSPCLVHVDCVSGFCGYVESSFDEGAQSEDDPKAFLQALHLNMYGYCTKPPSLSSPSSPRSPFIRTHKQLSG